MKGLFFFMVWILMAPPLTYLACETLPPVWSLVAGASLCASSIALGLWCAYRDSLPLVTRYDEDRYED